MFLVNMIEKNKTKEINRQLTEMETGTLDKHEKDSSSLIIK